MINFGRGKYEVFLKWCRFKKKKIKYTVIPVKLVIEKSGNGGFSAFLSSRPKRRDPFLIAIMSHGEGCIFRETWVPASAGMTNKEWWAG